VTRKWASVVTNALNAKPPHGVSMRAEVIYDPQRSHLKTVPAGNKHRKRAIALSFAVKLRYARSHQGGGRSFEGDLFAHTGNPQSMIRKSVQRFSEKIML